MTTNGLPRLLLSIALAVAITPVAQSALGAPPDDEATITVVEEGETPDDVVKVIALPERAAVEGKTKSASGVDIANSAKDKSGSGRDVGQQGSAESHGNSGESQGNSGESHGNSSESQGNSGESHGNSGESQGNSGESHGNSGESHGNSGESHGNSGDQGHKEAADQARNDARNDNASGAKGHGPH